MKTYSLERSDLAAHDAPRDTLANEERADMKIVSINGSPRGKTGNTNIRVDAILNGAKEAGAETVNILLSEKNIQHCKACHSCWFATPGKCATDDDMSNVLALMAGADVVLLASPVQFFNISGHLKVFMDRMTVIGSPHAKKRPETDKAGQAPVTPKLMMVSTCGHFDRSQFKVVSLWIKGVTMMMQTELIGEVYATQGKTIAAPPEELRGRVEAYIQTLKKAGREMAGLGRLSPESSTALEQDVIPAPKR